MNPSNPRPSDTHSWYSSNSSIPNSFVGITMDQANETNARAPDAEIQQGTNISATFMRIFGVLKERLKPWSDFFRFSKFGLPHGISGIGPRIKFNLHNFMSNYLCLFVVLLIYCIVTSFLMLLTMLVLAGLCYSIYQKTQKGPIVIAGQEIPPSLLYTLALMICIPLFALSNAGQVIYWVIGAGFFIVLAHATFYSSEEVPGAEFEAATAVQA